jgi:hypothetical protein
LVSRFLAAWHRAGKAGGVSHGGTLRGMRDFKGLAAGIYQILRLSQMPGIRTAGAMQSARSAAGCTDPLHRCPQLTNTFTLTPSGQIILVLALGLAALIMIAWLAGWLPWKAHSHFARMRDDLDHGWRDLSGLAMIILIALAFLWLALFALTIMATFGGVLAFWGKPSSGGLGLGAILAGLLGAPFLIWTTVIKQTTLGFQKEGHITDRISRAVEQLGAEKKVDRIGRSVTIWSGTSRTQSFGIPGTEVKEQPKRSIEIGRSPTLAENVSGDLVEATDLEFRIWSEERVVIQYHGDALMLGDDEAVGIESNWQVLSETVPNIEVRIGAILALERIAQDSCSYDRGRDHVRVMEVLCAYVRNNAPAKHAKSGPLTSLTSQSDLNQKVEAASQVLEWVIELPSPRADIVIAIRVIGGRTKAQRKIEAEHIHWDAKSYTPDLSFTNLQGADLERLDLTGTNFYRSRMEGAFCEKTNFSNCNFVEARLTGISGIDALFNHAKLASADFSGALLENANFSLCDFSHTHFVGTQLIGAIFKFLGPDSPISNPVNRIFMLDCNLTFAWLEGYLESAVIIKYVKVHEEKVKYFVRKACIRNASTALRSRRDSAEAEPSVIPIGLLQFMFGDASVDLGKTLPPSHWPTAILDDASYKTELQRWRANQEEYRPPSAP